MFIDLMMISLIIFLIILAPKYLKFRESDYMFESKNGFFKTLRDKGNYGEFLTFSYLEKLNTYNKIMTNLYIPKEDGTTTEIDLIMIEATGIYVFESKNYSGWIYGDEDQKNWTQTLNSNVKNKFYNPIWQNNGHVNALKKAIDPDNKYVFKSYIVFSERCELKKINIKSGDIKLLKRSDLYKTILKDIMISPNIFTKDDIDYLYFKLQKYAYMDEKAKEMHVINIEDYK